MAAQTLQELYKLESTGKEAVQKSAGYAVFNNMGANLFLLSTARGAGIAVNSSRNGKTLRYGKHTTLSIFPQLFTAVWKI
jgi:hypothetical protein